MSFLQPSLYLLKVRCRDGILQSLWNSLPEFWSCLNSRSSEQLSVSRQARWFHLMCFYHSFVVMNWVLPGLKHQACAGRAGLWWWRRAAALQRWQEAGWGNPLRSLRVIAAVTVNCSLVSYMIFTAGNWALACWYVNCVNHTAVLAFLELLLGEMCACRGLEWAS